MITSKDILKEAKKIANEFSGKLADLIDWYDSDLRELDNSYLDYEDLAQYEELLDSMESIEIAMDELDGVIQDIAKSLEK